MNRNFWIVVGALILVLVVLLVGGWKLAVLPLHSQYAAAIAQKQDIEQQLETARATAAQFGKFKTEAEEMKRNLQFYESRTDKPLDPVELSSQIGDLGNLYSLDKMQVSIAPPARGASGGGGGMQQTRLGVQFNADLSRLGQFLNACVGERRIIVPDAVTLRSYQDPTGLYQDTLNVELDLTAYGGSPAQLRRY